MISKLYRFKGHSSLKYLFKRGDTLRGKYITVRYINNPQTKNYRAAVVVSKKVSKSAPKRNRIRRRIFELVRLNGPKYLTNQDVAFIVFSDKIVSMPHGELEQIIVEQLKQISKIAKK